MAGLRTRALATLMDDLPRSLVWRQQREGANMGDEGTDVFFFVICRLEDDVPVGRLDLFFIDRAHGSAAFGIAIGDPALWGKGYGTDAVNAIAGLRVRTAPARAPLAGHQRPQRSGSGGVHEVQGSSARVCSAARLSGRPLERRRPDGDDPRGVAGARSTQELGPGGGGGRGARSFLAGASRHPKRRRVRSRREQTYHGGDNEAKPQ